MKRDPDRYLQAGSAHAETSQQPVSATEKSRHMVHGIADTQNHPLCSPGCQPPLPGILDDGVHAQKVVGQQDQDYTPWPHGLFACDPVCALSLLNGFTPRDYQAGPIEAILRSVLEDQGRTFVVVFPRQSGKNEIQAQIEAALMIALCDDFAEIVKISPTWTPQTQNAMNRLARVIAMSGDRLDWHAKLQ